MNENENILYNLLFITRDNKILKLENENKLLKIELENKKLEMEIFILKNNLS